MSLMLDPASHDAAGPEIAVAVAALGAVRRRWREGRSLRHRVDRFPSASAIEAAVDHLVAALFPQRLGGFAGPDDGEDAFVAARLTRGLAGLREQVASELDYWQAGTAARFDADQAATIVRLFAGELPRIRELVDSDVEAAFVGDPAARSIDEILICYPGALAILYHRIAHELYALGAAIVARIVSEIANRRTGIDIHPGATIGSGFFIDHGAGVVIGETAVVGARVQLYQHVTHGARSPLGKAQVSPRDRYARHPIVEDDVTIYAGATILGPVTIGRGSTIGGNVWLLDDVPADSVVEQPRAHVLDRDAAATLHDTLTGRGA